MSNFSEAFKIVLGTGPGGRQQYKELLRGVIDERVAEHETLVSAWKDTMKSMNGLSQLASQQVQQIENLTKQIASMAAKMEEANESNGDSKESEVKGE